MDLDDQLVQDERQTVDPPLCCNLVVPPKHPDADAGFIIMEQVEYPMMSDGNTIAVVYMRDDGEGKTTAVSFATYERMRP